MPQTLNLILDPQSVKFYPLLDPIYIIKMRRSGFFVGSSVVACSEKGRKSGISCFLTPNMAPGTMNGEQVHVKFIYKFIVFLVSETFVLARILLFFPTLII